MIELAIAICERCAKAWRPRTENPVKCVHCGSKEWNESAKKKATKRGAKK